ncbi:MAG: ATP-binding protein [Pseudomonadota bacterium]
MASLRARLLWSVGTVTLLVWCIAVAAGYLGARHEAIELLDSQLAQSARLLLSQVRHEMEDVHEGEEAEVLGAAPGSALVELVEGAPLHAYEQPLEFQVWSLDRQGHGELVLRSARAPAMPLRPRPGYADMEHGGEVWRTLTQRDAGGRLQVQVAQPTGGRARAALEVAMRVSLPFAVALPLLVALIFLAVDGGLRPLERLARDVGERAPDALAPLPTQDMPRETQPLLAALNDLLRRLGRALDNERRFTADAAHELRTPLAALQVQAQVARMAGDAATREHALGQVLAGVGRATRLVEQLLRLARLDPLSGVPEARPCEAAALLRQAAEALRPQAEAKGIAVAIAADDALAVRGDPDLLGLALRNLLENAVRYLPEGGRVTLGAERAESGIRLWVRDDGAGVAEEELARLTERFYRGRDVQAEGTGLGLAIVQRVAQLHGAGLKLENLPGGGFQATLERLAP